MSSFLITGNYVILNNLYTKKIFHVIMLVREDRDNMKCIIRGEKISVTSAISEYVETKISRLDKYFKLDDVTANVLVKVKGKHQSVEVTIPYDKYTLRGEETKDDLYAAIDLVVDKLEGQIRKTKSKLKKQIKKNETVLNFDYELSEEEEYKNKIVKRKQLELKPMSEEEAILQLELLGHDFFIYKDVHTNEIDILYKRKDGNYGVIETND